MASEKGLLGLEIVCRGVDVMADDEQDALCLPLSLKERAAGDATRSKAWEHRPLFSQRAFSCCRRRSILTCGRSPRPVRSLLPGRRRRVQPSDTLHSTLPTALYVPCTKLILLSCHLVEVRASTSLQSLHTMSSSLRRFSHW